jgi:hypothetical protein
MSDSSPPEFDIASAAERIRAEERLETVSRQERFREAKSQLEAALAVLRGFPAVRRVITWGSILRP